MRKAPKLALFFIGLVAITFVTTSFNYSSTPVEEAAPTKINTIEVNYPLMEAQGAGQYQADQDAIKAYLANQEEKRVQEEAVKAKAQADAKTAWNLAHPVVQLSATEIPPLLARIRDCESGDYTRENQQGSSASGAYQILDSTWRGWRNLVEGASNYARAKDAPPAIQDAVALAAFNIDGATPWAASKRCWSK